MNTTITQTSMFRSLCTIAPLLLLAFGIYAGDAPKAPVSISIPDQKTLKFVYTSFADFGPSCEFELSYERLSSAPTNASVLCEAYSENERGDAKFEFAVYHSVKIPDTKGKVKVHILPVTQPKEPPTLVKVSLIESTKPQVPKCVSLLAGGEVTTISAPSSAKAVSNQLKVPAR